MKSFIKVFFAFFVFSFHQPGYTSGSPQQNAAQAHIAQVFRSHAGRDAVRRVDPQPSRFSSGGESLSTTVSHYRSFDDSGLFSSLPSPSEAEVNDDDSYRPAEHLCPITLQVMQDPVVAKDVCSYERRAILEYFQEQERNRRSITSPLMGTPISKDLIPNISLKKMIEDWQKPSEKPADTSLDKKSPDEIADQIQREFQKNTKLFHAAKGQHIVALLGNTGSGKSTLGNLLIGKELIVGPEGDDYVLENPTDASSMKIGREGSSETLYPNFADYNGLRFFDLPGFNDTDGSERNLVNAAFMRQILLEAASVRLIFVMGNGQFMDDRGLSAKNMFRSISQLFISDHTSQQDFISQGALVVTKAICSADANISDILLRRTNSQDKEALNTQLQAWNRSGRICHMCIPAHNNNAPLREILLNIIRTMSPVKINGINVSALYPPETKTALERVFFTFYGKKINR